MSEVNVKSLDSIASVWSQKTVETGGVVHQSFEVSLKDLNAYVPELFISNSPQSFAKLQNLETTINKDLVKWNISWVALGGDVESSLVHTIDMRDSSGQLIQKIHVVSDSLPQVLAIEKFETLDLQVDSIWKTELLSLRPYQKKVLDNSWFFPIAVIALFVLAAALRFFIKSKRLIEMNRESHVLSQLKNWIRAQELEQINRGEIEGDQELGEEEYSVGELAQNINILIGALFNHVTPGLTMGQISDFLKNQKSVNIKKIVSFKKGIGSKRQVKGFVFSDPRLKLLNFNSVSFDEQSVEGFYKALIDLVKLLDYEVLQSYQARKSELVRLEIENTNDISTKKIVEASDLQVRLSFVLDYLEWSK